MTTLYGLNLSALDIQLRDIALRRTGVGTGRAAN
jgi:hypothetical protein